MNLEIKTKSRHSSMPIIIDINANIGSGKSTLLSFFKDQSPSSPLFKKQNNEGYYKVGFLPEPVTTWMSIKDKDGVNILTHYYQDQEKWSFAFQMMAYITRLSSFREALRENKYDIIITERSMMTDYHVFAKMLYDSGKINEIEMQIYTRWFDEFIDELLCRVKTVYMCCDPSVSHGRVSKRARPGEEVIELEYLQLCHQYHEEWLGSGKADLTIDCSTDISNDEEDETLRSWATLITGLFVH